MKALPSTGSLPSEEERQKYIPSPRCRASARGDDGDKLWKISIILPSGKGKEIPGRWVSNLYSGKSEPSAVSRPRGEWQWSAKEEAGWAQALESGKSLAKEFGLYPVGNEETTEDFKQRLVTWSDLCFSKIIAAVGWNRKRLGQTLQTFWNRSSRTGCPIGDRKEKAHQRWLCRWL